MPGVDLVLPDFTYLRERRRRGSRASSSPTRTRTTPAGSPSCCATSRSRSTARRCRSGWPGTASRRPGCSTAPQLIPVLDGERRQIGPFDVEFIPVTHSVPHAFAAAYHTPQGTILHTRRLQDRPHAGRRPPHRPRPPRRDRARRAARTAVPRRAAALGLHERRASRLHAVGVDGRRRDAHAVPRPRGQAVHRRELRVAPPPRAAGGRGRDRRPAGSSRSSAGR